MNLRKRVLLMCICTLIADSNFEDDQGEILDSLIEEYKEKALEVSEEIENTSEEELFNEIVDIFKECFEESEDEPK